MVEKKAEPASKEAPAKAEPKPEPEVEVEAPKKTVAAKAAAKAEPKPEPVRAGGHVLTEDTGWAVEEEG